MKKLYSVLLIGASLLKAESLIVTPNIIDLANDNSKYSIQLYNNNSVFKTKYMTTLTNRFLILNINSHNLKTNSYFNLKIAYTNIENYSISNVDFSFNNFEFITTNFDKYDVPQISFGFLTKGFYKNTSYFKINVGLFKQKYDYYTLNTFFKLNSNISNTLTSNISIGLNSFIDKKARKQLFINIEGSIQNNYIELLGGMYNLFKKDNKSPLDYVVLHNQSYYPLPFDIKNEKQSKFIYYTRLQYKILKTQNFNVYLTGSYTKNISIENLYSLGIKITF